MAEVTVIMVSYNTRELTCTAIDTLLRNAGDVTMDIIVWDNASEDGSADAVAERFADINLIRSDDNVGFGAANNAAAKLAQTEWLLLLNPDTETHPNAVANLLAFAKAHPEAGIVGGRTVFPDGTLNIASCWNRMTPWSLFCNAVGLSRVFSSSELFNPEGIGGWKRDTVRKVDIVVGCFFMIRTSLWRELGGFSPRYFMYGEESDMCLRAAKIGYRPMITPDAQIMHLVGASSKRREDKVLRLMRAKATLIQDHWSNAARPFGITMLWLWIAMRRAGSALLGLGSGGSSELWKQVWRQRRAWLGGYR
ncbi:glycosyltransferase family 2 protein [Aurantiacibacter marinus]|uniref:Glycosyl transferase family 2 n=1 Tax=Aurantiacibacter marinus TaxID=874156 RepID=A0A0H0XPT6_9SPHN|nr:glycosyltransferase family 2 protein [Aurantiacibacter marinus]KLI64638.1 glycosyl transferase family 2 [Aurantiacibacter marinus]